MDHRWITLLGLSAALWVGCTFDHDPTSPDSSSPPHDEDRPGRDDRAEDPGASPPPEASAPDAGSGASVADVSFLDQGAGSPGDATTAIPGDSGSEPGSGHGRDADSRDSDPGADHDPGAASDGHGPPYPIVLQHGWTGFESIGPIEYFFRVKEHLEGHGFEVYVSEVDPYNDSVVRGRELAENIDRILAESGAAKVNVIAHSQGGIDARYVISTLGYGDRIASLTTISTPHRGTKIGDAYIGRVPGWADPLAQALAWLVGRSISDLGDDPAFRASMWQVSEEAMDQFNRDNPDDPRVAYYSWAGRTFMSLGRGVCDQGEVPNPRRVDPCTIWLQATGRFVGGSLLHPKPNDGLITVESAMWGRFRGCIPADHIDEVGHILQMAPDPISGFDHLHFYLNMARFLRAEGF